MYCTWKWRFFGDHTLLFLCCSAFPWIIDIFELNAYSFYKVIETFIKVEEGLSRDVVKHLNHVRRHLIYLLSS